MYMWKKVVALIKRETVLVVAMVLAVVSAFIVTPSMKYLDYIDWRVLGILLSLMIIMAGFQKNGLFDQVGNQLLSKTRNTRQLSLVLVFLCFFLSMLITNDVALLTFVPLTVLILEKCQRRKLMIPVIILQTLAANLGSMFTPIGNPQNLYLYQLSSMQLGDFFLCMLPYTLLAVVLLLVSVFWIARKKGSVEVVLREPEKNPEIIAQRKKRNVVYLVLFILCLLVVLRILPYQAVLLLVLLLVGILDRQVLKQVDYCLLLTFICFFVFTGNMGSIPFVKETLQQLVSGRELGIGILSSQFISNVPAALLLSGFTEDYRTLLEGVNIGGLGTLIASMASLISYKIFAQYDNCQKGKYLLWFTVVNLVFLVILVLAAVWL